MPETKLCPDTHEEVMWAYINQPKCSVCKVFVNYKSVEEVDGWIDIAERHYPNGLRVGLGPHGGSHQ